MRTLRCGNIRFGTFGDCIRFPDVLASVYKERVAPCTLTLQYIHIKIQGRFCQAGPSRQFSPRRSGKGSYYHVIMAVSADNFSFDSFINQRRTCLWEKRMLPSENG